MTQNQRSLQFDSRHIIVLTLMQSAHSGYILFSIIQSIIILQLQKLLLLTWEVWLFGETRLLSGKSVEGLFRKLYMYHNGKEIWN